MEFYRPKRKVAEVSIVPLIDILVTLLFFFIVTMQNLTPKTPKPETQVALPSAHSLEVKTTTVTRTILSVDSEGKTELDGLVVSREFLKEYLVGNLRNRPGVKLAMRVDRGCDFQHVLFAFSEALEAGYTQKDIYFLVDRSEAGAVSE